MKAWKALNRGWRGGELSFRRCMTTTATAAALQPVVTDPPSLVGAVTVGVECSPALAPSVGSSANALLGSLRVKRTMAVGTSAPPSGAQADHFFEYTIFESCFFFSSD